jgi:hypothetical protein
VISRRSKQWYLPGHRAEGGRSYQRGSAFGGEAVGHDVGELLEEAVGGAVVVGETVLGEAIRDTMSLKL